MSDRDAPDIAMEGIQRVRDRARQLKEMILNAARGNTVMPQPDTVQKPPQEASAKYMEIRPEGSRSSPATDRHSRRENTRKGKPARE